MNHIKVIQAALAAEDLDAVLLTGQANRFYAAGFFTPGGDAACLVPRKGPAYFFTDARYTEAAGRCLENAELRETKTGQGLTVQLHDLVFLKSIRRLGFEDAEMSVREHGRFQKAMAQWKFPCEMVPASDLVTKLRHTKDKEELAAMEAAQGIAERALAEDRKSTRLNSSHSSAPRMPPSA